MAIQYTAKYKSLPPSKVVHSVVEQDSGETPAGEYA